MPDRFYPDLPADPSDEELARDWTLSTEDEAEIEHCRRDENRHRYALQLCALRTLGHFIDDFDSVPVKILNHIGRQLGLAPTLFIEPSDRRATWSKQAERIRKYLDCRPFDEEAQDLLRAWLDDRVTEGILPGALLSLTVNTLRGWKIELPARSTIERLVGGSAARAETEVWRRIHERLSPDFCGAVDKMLLVDKPDRKSALFQFKEYPPESRPAAILDYLERWEQLRSLGAGAIDFGGLSGEMIEHLAGLGRRYDVDDLRRFAPA